MTRDEIKDYAQKQLDKHGYGGMDIVWGRGRTRIASVAFTLGVPIELRLSSNFLPHLDDDEIKDVILHEVAHCIAGAKAGHGPRWKRVAASLGAKPERTLDVDNEILDKVSKYKTWCRDCGEEYYFNRRSEYPIEGRVCRCGGTLTKEVVLR